MKKLTELTAEELIVNPVWEHWTSDNIEYVQKTDKTELFDEGDKGYIVLTDFIFNNQTKHLGFCSPLDPSGLDYVQPVVFTKNGQVVIFTEHERSPDQLKVAIENMVYSWAEIFPIVYTARIPTYGIIHSGVILDFNLEKENVT